jgi:hypothetical protein
MPRHTKKTDKAIFLVFGVLKAQDGTTAKIDL